MHDPHFGHRKQGSKHWPSGHGLKWAFEHRHSRGRRAPAFLLPVLVAVIALVGSFGAARHQDGVIDAPAIMLLLAGPVALLWRKKFPVPVFVAVVAITGGYFVLGYPRGPVFLALIVALFTLVFSGHRLLAWGSIALGVSGFIGYQLLRNETISWAELTGVAVWGVLVLSIAEAVRIGRIARDETRRTMAEEQRRRASDERLAIARELHDVLAHNISLINVQSSVALHLLDDDPAQARAALTTIKQASKDTLKEMRSVLGVLRRVDEDAPRAPIAVLRDIPTLVKQLGAAGLTVHLEEKNPKPLPTSVDQAAYRITQEALTNVIRHSQATSAAVRIEYSSQELLLRIDDPGPADAPSEESGGNGIIGMRERASALGGELTAVTKPDGGFRVTAHLPLDSPAGSENDSSFAG